MSFYGNVATTNQSQFTFDKTYPNIEYEEIDTSKPVLD